MNQKAKLIASVGFFVAMGGAVMAGEPRTGDISSDQCAEAMASSGLVTVGDFEPYRLEDGRSGIKVQKPEQGVMLSCIGTPTATEEVIAAVAPSADTARAALFMLFAVAQKFAAWDEAPDWVSGSLKAMGDDGGRAAIVKHGRLLTLRGMPNGVVMLNISTEE